MWKKCVYDYCGHHRINIRKTGFEPQPCRNCGVGQNQNQDCVPPKSVEVINRVKNALILKKS